MRLRLLHLLPALVCLQAARAQEPSFSGVVRGVLIECDAQGTAGEFALRAQQTNQVYRFAFDAKTYVERETLRTSMNRLPKGDLIEVVADRDESVAVHYARTVHVIEARPEPPQPTSAGRYRMYRTSPYRAPAPALDLLFPRGNLTFSGVIARVAADRLVLHTRQEGEKTILLRFDTRFLEEGSPVDAVDLKPNTRVFVRAGRNLENQIEAYQIVWGQILEPGHFR